ncbi:hypothetical protein ABZP36_030327 [Zizania latifolia]
MASGGASPSPIATSMASGILLLPPIGAGKGMSFHAPPPHAPSRPARIDPCTSTKPPSPPLLPPSPDAGPSHADDLASCVGWKQPKHIGNDMWDVAMEHRDKKFMHCCGCKDEDGKSWLFQP